MTTLPLTPSFYDPVEPERDPNAPYTTPDVYDGFPVDLGRFGGASVPTQNLPSGLPDLTTLIGGLGKFDNLSNELPAAGEVQTWDQWQQAGGPKDWDMFRAHARAIGQPDPGPQPTDAPATDLTQTPSPQTVNGMPGVAAPGTPEHAQAIAERDRNAAQQGASSTPAVPAASAPGPAVATPAPSPVSTPGQPAQATTPTRESLQDVWILPDGRMVAPTPNKTPPVGTVRVKLTASQIRGAVNPPATNAPLDPGKALAAPSAGQLAVDSRPVTIAATLLGKQVNSKPLDGIAAAQVSRTAGPGIPDEVIRQRSAGMVKALAQGIASGGNSGTEAILNDIARMAWYRQTGGMINGVAVTPEEAPQDYIESWKGLWRTGGVAPLTAALDQQLIDNGVVPPSAKAAVQSSVSARQGVDPKALVQAGTGYAKSQAVQRLAQGDRGQYQGFSEAEFNAWKAAGCSAASFAAMVNAADPTKKWTVGDAVNFLKQRHLIDTQNGLLRGSDFTDVSAALDEAIGSDATYSVNLTSPDAVKKHFASGGGAIMFTGPSGAVWGVPHIYVVTGATEQGVTIVDSSAANKTALTWDEWRRQTALPGMGAGAALFKNPNQNNSATAVDQGNPYLVSQSQQAGGGAQVTDPNTGIGSTRAKEEGTGGRGRPSLYGGKTDNVYTEEDVRSVQRDLAETAPDVNIRPGMSFDQRVQAWQPMLHWIEARTGMPSDLVAGLIYAENRFGESNLSANHNNWFSMEYNPQYDTYAKGTADGRFASYATAKDAVARWIGVLSHPQNTYNTRASLWAQRGDAEATLQNLVKGGYIVDEPGFPVSSWMNNVRQGMRTYRSIVG